MKHVNPAIGGALGDVSKSTLWGTRAEKSFPASPRHSMPEATHFTNESIELIFG